LPPVAKSIQDVTPSGSVTLSRRSAAISIEVAFVGMEIAGSSW